MLSIYHISYIIYIYLFIYICMICSHTCMLFGIIKKILASDPKHAPQMIGIWSVKARRWYASSSEPWRSSGGGARSAPSWIRAALAARIREYWSFNWTKDQRAPPDLPFLKFWNLLETIENTLIFLGSFSNLIAFSVSAVACGWIFDVFRSIC